MGERSDGVNVICDAIAGGLGSEFVGVVLGKLFYNEWAKHGESLVALRFGFPFSNGGVKGASAFHSGFEECKVTVWVSRNSDLHDLLFDLVVTYKLGGRVLGWILHIVHGADEFLDVDVIQSSTVGAEVVKDFDGCAVSGK